MALNRRRLANDQPHLLELCGGLSVPEAARCFLFSFRDSPSAILHHGSGWLGVLLHTEPSQPLRPCSTPQDARLHTRWLPFPDNMQQRLTARESMVPVASVVFTSSVSPPPPPRTIPCPSSPARPLSVPPPALHATHPPTAAFRTPLAVSLLRGMAKAW